MGFAKNPAAMASRAGLGVTCSLRRSENSPGNNTHPSCLQSPRYEPRFRLGAPAVACLLEEVAAGRDPRQAVAEYASLDGDIVRIMGGGNFRQAIRALDGGRRS
jgi:hypothetical protein